MIRHNYYSDLLLKSNRVPVLRRGEKGIRPILALTRTHQMSAVFPFLDSLALRFSHDLSVLIRSHELFTWWPHWEKLSGQRRMLQNDKDKHVSNWKYERSEVTKSSNSHVLGGRVLTLWSLSGLKKSARD